MYSPDGRMWQAEYLSFNAGAAENSQQAGRAGNGAAGIAADLSSASSGGNCAAGPASAASGSTGGESDAAAVDSSDLRLPTAAELPDFIARLVAQHGAAAIIALPSAAELPDFIARLVSLHGAAAVVASLLRVVPASRLQEACDRAWGVSSDDEEEQFARVSIGEASLQTPPTAPRAGRVSMLDSRPVQGMIPTHCFACEPQFGRADSECAAIALLNTLTTEIEEAERRVAEMAQQCLLGQVLGYEKLIAGVCLAAWDHP